MLDAVTFDLGCASPPTFVFPDASGLAPLTLPDEFLHRQSHQPQPEFPSDTVRRFETAMSAEPQLSPSVIESFMAHMISGSPKAESQKVSADAVVLDGSVVHSADEKPVVESPVRPKIQVATRPAEPTVVVEKVSVKRAPRPMVATVERPAVESTDEPVAAIVDRPTVVTVEVPTVSAVEKPVAAAPMSADKPVVSAVEAPKVVEVERPLRSAVEAPTVVEVERPVVSAVEAPKVVEVERPVRSAVEAPTVVEVERPVRSAVEAPTVVEVERPVRSAVEAPTVVEVERPVVSAVEAPTVVEVERPVVDTAGNPTIVTAERPVVPPAEHTVAPVVLENRNSRVEVKEPAVAASGIPTTPAALSAESAAMVETPAAVDKPIGALVEQIVEGSAAVTAERAIPERSVVRPVDDKPVAASPERPAKQAVVATPAASAVAVEVPTGVTIEKPMQSGSIGAPTVVPVVSEEPVNRVEAVDHPVAASGTPVAPAPSDVRPLAEAETPAIATPAEPNGIIEKAPVAPAERPIAVKVSNPTVATVDKTEEKAVAAAAHVVVAPTAVEAPAPQVLQASPEVAAASAASARTEVLVETVNQIVEAVVGEILVTPGITQGECEIKIMLKPTVLDGSEVSMSAKDGTLTVSITPATQEASAAAAAALPRLEIALAEHAPAFHHVSVALQLKKGNRSEAV